MTKKKKAPVGKQVQKRVRKVAKQKVLEVKPAGRFDDDGSAKSYVNNLKQKLDAFKDVDIIKEANPIAASILASEERRASKIYQEGKADGESAGYKKGLLEMRGLEKGNYRYNTLLIFIRETSFLNFFRLKTNLLFRKRLSL